MIKVSIVEDDAGIRESLPIVLNGASGFRCISTFANAEVAIKMMPRNWPDIVLMDINLPNMSGIECVAKLKEMNSALQVIMLTVHLDNEAIMKSLMAGAAGYLIKQTPPAEILEAVADVHRGGSPMSFAIARKVVQHFHQKKSPNETANLSKRETEVLSLLAKGHQYKEVAEELSISFLTVRAHIRNIYEKLQVRSRTEAIVKFLGQSGKT